ncbi:peptide ABC transporter permease [Zobellella denitrificans]|jgi:cationic peptide transport system permease protein|uniref:Peptide ABC transporter permease n=1 Tax=Zobellella denitrificans TaxID=347534 RepID=A0A231MYQ9_9GAMM|nr:ABC transporter permease subunit [Zobellella denitrificans]ATG73603.1 peptide ABC transporter permease [Zobellella denitrificans]OXS15288.1 peptide ABC transporter permease [Zobellella denitrificans]
MLRYLLRRLNLLLTTLLMLTLIAYALEYHLLTDIRGDFWSGYLVFIRQLLAGDFGISSATGMPVLGALGQYFPATLELCLAAFVISMVVGVPVGTLAALRQGRWQDTLILTGTLVGYSVPVFWLGLLLVMFFSLNLGWLPVSGQLSLLYDISPVTGIMTIDALLAEHPYRWPAFLDALRHLVLPSLVLAIVPTTEVIRQIRSALLEVMKQNYIRAALTKGLSETQVMLRHGLRNAFPMAIPTLGLQLGTVLTSAMMTEIVFDWPGLGRWLVTSIALQDYAAIKGGTLAIATFTVVANVLVDIVSTLIYPTRRKALYAKQG